jgi:hypothetical protein
MNNEGEKSLARRTRWSQRGGAATKSSRRRKSSQENKILTKRSTEWLNTYYNVCRLRKALTGQPFI